MGGVQMGQFQDRGIDAKTDLVVWERRPVGATFGGSEIRDILGIHKIKKVLMVTL